MSYTPTPDEMRQMYDLVSVNAARIRRQRQDIDREDLVSEGLYAVAGILNRYDPTSQATLWTYAQPRVRGAMLDYIEQRMRIQHREVEIGPDAENASYSVEHDGIDIERCMSAMQSAKHRTLLRAWSHGHTYAETARRLGLNETWVRRHTEIAIEELRRIATGPADILGNRTGGQAWTEQSSTTTFDTPSSEVS